ncbi:hypothetical protein MVEN_01949300 [Mycena venus]|uniref:Peroxidase n=1 Tax=Mycena venus TaxID=2733690 RepID=A0A8H7CLF7_9AGAR|nr:hypothetical protein MVEN_01949300 [Mycena venus]
MFEWCQMLLIPLLASLVPAHAYIWPSPRLDALESIRYDSGGHNSLNISDLIVPCDLFSFSPSPSGRLNVADWIRTVIPAAGSLVIEEAHLHQAYHDMATHNVVDGTGGLDASIRFPEEQARSENAGDGFSNTLAILLPHSNRYVSIADVVALGAIMAFENCGGPELAFRGGRLDAGEPNVPGVPQPQQDLQQHIDMFARQGFTQTEMISLVACGHSFGGVQHDPFPDIAPELNDPNNLRSVSHFDLTPQEFDNRVAEEYISGQTRNPLVVGLNDTTNSDKRIFGSDGNATMLSFAQSPALFASTCADLLTRMVDTVPSGVQLTEVIKPPACQARGSATDSDRKHAATVWGSPVLIALRTSACSSGTNRGTQIDKPASSGPTALVRHRTSRCRRPAHPSRSPDTTSQRGSRSTLPATRARGVASMRFMVDGALEDQGGVGFALQDGIVFSNTSCQTSTQNPRTARLDIAVRTGLNPTRVVLEQEARDSVDRPIVITTPIPPPTAAQAVNDVYKLWSITITDNGLTTPYTISAEVDGVDIAAHGRVVLSMLPVCAD